MAKYLIAGGTIMIWLLIMISYDIISYTHIYQDDNIITFWQYVIYSIQYNDGTIILYTIQWWRRGRWWWWYNNLSYNKMRMMRTMMMIISWYLSSIWYNDDDDDDDDDDD